MAISDISLTASMRSVLISLQDTQSKLDRTSERLATGLKVNSPLDNPAAYFTAASHRGRADQLAGRKEAIGEAIQTIKAAGNGLEAVTGLINTAKGLADAARSESVGSAQRASYASQYGVILSQLNQLVEDSNYKGTNFLQGATLSVVFNETGTNTFSITGFSADATSLFSAAGAASGADFVGAGGSAVGSFSADSQIDAVATKLDNILVTLRLNAASLSSSLSVLSSRDSFITDINNTLIEGADKLTLADLNEEGSNLLLLQTRQQLGTTSLSIASQSAQSILRLF